MIFLIYLQRFLQFSARRHLVAERWYEKTKWPMMSVLSTTLH
jgi:hypothetical protein